MGRSSSRGLLLPSAGKSQRKLATTRASGGELRDDEVKGAKYGPAWTGAAKMLPVTERFGGGRRLAAAVANLSTSGCPGP